MTRKKKKNESDDSDEDFFKNVGDLRASRENMRKKSRFARKIPSRESDNCDSDMRFWENRFYNYPTRIRVT